MSSLDGTVLDLVLTQKTEQLSDMGQARLLLTQTLSNSDRNMQSELHSISPHAVA